ncbi:MULTISPECIES: L-idonate 5-dehydrogenase [unclassified Meridianimarinicoccus]|uniref:L-idonate 5-dehydrogenase n=1 Tax=unclassified Meridianimarinicoccus TaxID=2923344 RepID=UPI00186740F4|nr:L-idonate 5-dehydrogenase [Fluviibacterium sp. MJW13]
MTIKACVLHKQNDLRVDEVALDDMGPDDVRVAMTHGGICGSDMHYYQDGGFGPVRVIAPIILGHEVSGVIEAVGAKVGDLQIGDRVAVSPSQPCFDCEYCAREEFQHCVNMRFMGSARTVPHVQGGFRSKMVTPQRQCFKIGKDTPLANAACSEPLAVCLHAAAQAGPLGSKKVLVTGAGPIGALCVAVAKMQGADSIVVTDLFDFTLAVSERMGATKTINIGANRDGVAEYVAEHGPFDIVFECSAAEPAILSAIAAVRPRGTIVQVGVAGSLSLPINAIVGKEINFKGTHRFHPEFAQAVDLIDRGVIDVTPIVTQTYPLEDAVEAFKTAANREKAVKVQLKLEAP